MMIVVFWAFAVVFAIAFISGKFASRIQFLVLGVVGFSLFSVALGSFSTAVQPGMIYEPTWLGTFPGGDFWFVFSVFPLPSPASWPASA